MFDTWVVQEGGGQRFRLVVSGRRNVSAEFHNPTAFNTNGTSQHLAQKEAKVRRGAAMEEEMEEFRIGLNLVFAVDASSSVRLIWSTRQNGIRDFRRQPKAPLRVEEGTLTSGING